MLKLRELIPPYSKYYIITEINPFMINSPTAIPKIIQLLSGHFFFVMSTTQSISLYYRTTDVDDGKAIK